MITVDLQDLGVQLSTIESVALIPRVHSTLELANRVLGECIENELPVPSSMILANEQLAGRGRAGRSWHSPAGKGIYATMTFSIPREGAALLPLSFAVAAARFLRETWSLDVRLKWPNDILISGRKIAGILISARYHEERAYVAAGIGINVRHTGDAPDNATSVEDEIDGEVDLEQASLEFIRFFDERFERIRSSDEILDEWRELTVHEDGDPIRCQVGDSVVTGAWAGVDGSGRAVLSKNGQQETIAAGDLIDWK